MTPRKKDVPSAVERLRRDFLAADESAARALEQERLNVHVARLIRERRTAAGLNQRELAERLGTTQSVVSRLESADYEGHSLTMLNRIAHVLAHHLDIAMRPLAGPATGATPEASPDEAAGAPAAPQERGELRFAFRELLRNLRRERGLTVQQLARRSAVDEDELLTLERDPDARPTPMTLYQLSRFYDIPERRLAMLAGAITDAPPELHDEASRFAAKSESFAKLTREEKRVLDEFVRFLKSER